MSDDTTPATSTSPGAAEVLALIRRMNLSERELLLEQLEKRPSVLNPTGYTIVPIELLEILKRVFRTTFDQVVKLSKDSSRRKRHRSPETIARDAEIVRLRDEEHRTFGAIPRLLLLIKPAWGRKPGQPLKRDTVEKAYHRAKARTTDRPN